MDRDDQNGSKEDLQMAKSTRKDAQHYKSSGKEQLSQKKT